MVVVNTIPMGHLKLKSFSLNSYIFKKKPNTKKPVYNPERYSDELVYWIAVKEILLNKML